MNKKTKILATIGPASNNKESIEGLILAGVNAFRLNFSHGTHESHKETLNLIKKVSKKLKARIGILQDICGPKIRVSEIDGEWNLKEGDLIEFSKNECKCEILEDKTYKISINQPEVLRLVNVGEQIFLYDGNIQTRVIQVEDKIIARVENNGILVSNKGVNFPNTKINLDILTKKDKEDLLWGVEHGVDFVAISFVQNKQDVLKVKNLLQANGSKASIVSKIEKFDAVENIDEILSASDAIMIARGDLGIEVPYFRVPGIQKQIIKKANAASKPVITATQMLLSMARNKTATRAEISDVANAVLDGTDAVMLSEETAIGKNPVNVVKTMANTIVEIEKFYPYNKFDNFECLDETDMVSSSTARLANGIGASAILSLTSSGKSAQKLSRYRTNINIFAITHDKKTARKLTLSWGICPILTVENTNLEFMLSDCIQQAMLKGYIDIEQKYLVTAGYPTGVEGSTNFIRILKKDQINYYLELA